MNLLETFVTLHMTHLTLQMTSHALSLEAIYKTTSDHMYPKIANRPRQGQTKTHLQFDTECSYIQ